MVRSLVSTAALVAAVASGLAAPAAVAENCPGNNLIVGFSPYVCAHYVYDRYGNQVYVVGTCATSPCRTYEVHLDATWNESCRRVLPHEMC